jgi:hypothetical protein
MMKVFGRTAPAPGRPIQWKAVDGPGHLASTSRVGFDAISHAGISVLENWL